MRTGGSAVSNHKIACIPKISSKIANLFFAKNLMLSYDRKGIFAARLHYFRKFSQLR